MPPIKKLGYLYSIDDFSPQLLTLQEVADEVGSAGEIDPLMPGIFNPLMASTPSPSSTSSDEEIEGPVPAKLDYQILKRYLYILSNLQKVSGPYEDHIRVKFMDEEESETSSNEEDYLSQMAKMNLYPSKDIIILVPQPYLAGVWKIGENTEFPKLALKSLEKIHNKEDMETLSKVQKYFKKMKYCLLRKYCGKGSYCVQFKYPKSFLKAFFRLT